MVRCGNCAWLPVVGGLRGRHTSGLPMAAIIAVIGSYG